MVCRTQETSYGKSAPFPAPFMINIYQYTTKIDGWNVQYNVVSICDEDPVFVAAYHWIQWYVTPPKFMYCATVHIAFLDPVLREPWKFMEYHENVGGGGWQYYWI